MHKHLLTKRLVTNRTCVDSWRHKGLLRLLLMIFVASFFMVNVHAQNQSFSNWRTLSLTPSKLPQQLDSLTVIPSSVTVFVAASGDKLDQTAYQIVDNKIKWTASFFKAYPKPTSVDISYRVFGFHLGAVQAHIDTSNILLADDGSYIGSFEYAVYEGGSNSLVDFKGLDYNGSFLRGISFGNNQNLVLNSSFNLRLSGNLGDDVEILAAITDDNIPLQPEGNTQQLQEFDKIFIQLKKKQSSLTAGDYELSRPNSYFMNYYKKLQGATFSNQSELFSKGTLSTKASIAAARGKFARQIINAQEGNQGPYKLNGAEGERFIIVLSGTERIFIDGQLMIRGLEEDYVIDYNRGEIAFTNRRLITKDSRIIVEFEYNVQNYLRSMYALDTEFQAENYRVYFNFFSEQDSKSSGGLQDLTVSDRQRLADIGNDLANAFTSGIDTLEELSEFRVKYILTDTTITYDVGSRIYFDSILVFSTTSDSAKYVASFSAVGAGNGNYIQIPSSANGRVYQWVAPNIDGSLNGNFEPIIRLVPPNKRQMMAFGGSYKINKTATLSAEIALSNNDPNRFSEIGDDNNKGMGVSTNYSNSQKLGKKEKGWRLRTNLGYEFIQQKFEALNPYRKAEFTRDWNLTARQVNSNSNQIANSDIQESSEHLGKAGFTLYKDKLGSLQYEYGTFIKNQLYTGNKHFSKLNIKKSGFEVDLQGSLLESTSLFEESQFFRPKANISKTFTKLNNWKIGVAGEQEKNSRRDIITDTLSPASFYYDAYNVYIESAQEGDFSIGANYKQRQDYQPVLKQFSQSTLADEFNLNGRWQQSAASQLRWNLTYRKLQIQDETLTTQDPQDTYLGRLEYTLRLFKGAILSFTNYEIGSGQEPKIEYQYLPVNQGEGTYLWIDKNEDGNVQLDEVEIAPFADQANAVRVTIFTDEFIRTNNVGLNQSININPGILWKREKGFKKFLGRFSTKSLLVINRRTLESDAVTPWNPFQVSVQDTSLVSVNYRIQNILTFNKGSDSFFCQIGDTDNRSKIVLTTGFQSQETREQFFRSLWNISRKFTFEVDLKRGNRFSDSEFFNTRDYNIEYYQLAPKLTYRPSRSFRTSLSYKFVDNINTLSEGGETAVFNDFNIDAKYNRTAATSFIARFSFVQIKYVGAINTPVSFAMLQGLQNGENYLWNLTFSRNISKNVRLNLLYDGRKTGTANVVHVGSVQIGAT